MVHPEIRHTVPNEEIDPAKVRSNIIEHAAHEEESQVTQNDELSILGLIQRAVGVEVVDASEITIPLALSASLGVVFMVVVAGDIGEQVHGPAEELLQDQIGGSQKGGLLHQLRQLVSGFADNRGILFPGLGDEHHVTADVAGGFVVFAV